MIRSNSCHLKDYFLQKTPFEELPHKIKEAEETILATPSENFESTSITVYKDKEIINSIFGHLEVPEEYVNEYLELIKSTKEEEIGERWKDYVIFKNPEEAAFLGYSANQENYGKWMHQTVRLSVKGLKKKDWNFDKLLRFLRCCREYESLRHTSGEERTQPGCSFLGGPYKVIADFFKSYQPDGVTCIETKRGLTFFSYLRGEKIKLSSLSISEKPLIYQGKETFGGIDHTDPEVAAKIMEFVKSGLYPKALQETDREELKRILGKIFWWICQAKPWLAGDPSIAETLIRTIWQSKGFESLSWKEGIIPWAEVVKEADVEKFAENFHKLFN
ncbi:hypothetical protein [Criblamydia sequanensis]|uniref:Uncharacterized protein n=1 Tax=Candidatus Criblamydia sequanensis CRIB-18 TaxID=1437425 RepID=A0A090D0H1_9BACT|nr:hypothetical protein [Criblamydia sequanensis]CDR34781.1 hypothetical protein CSEC_1974 [Criblamydia sequanensis CRIB-18]